MSRQIGREPSPTGLAIHRRQKEFDRLVMVFPEIRKVLRKGQGPKRPIFENLGGHVSLMQVDIRSPHEDVPLQICVIHNVAIDCVYYSVELWQITHCV